MAGNERKRPVIRRAESEAEKRAVFRFRYDVYVAEMNRYGSIADHDNRLLIEPDDATARLHYADDGDRVVGAMRWSWGGDAPLTARHIEQYDLAPFLESVPERDVVIGERFMLARDYRGSDLLSRMFHAYLEFVNRERIQLIFGDCEPHLLNLYLGLGFRTYTDRNVNSTETGYLIPLVMVAEDVEYMRAIGSPLAEVLTDFGDHARVPEAARQLLAARNAVLSHRLTARSDYWSEVQAALTAIEENRISFLVEAGPRSA